jgi:hypothetical protein
MSIAPASWAVTVTAIAVCVMINGCNSGPELHFTGVAGQKCPEPCSEACKDEFLGQCACETCVEIGYDPAAKQLLSCSSSSGLWEFRQDCPGGVSVKCDGHSYIVSCMDEAGQELR